MRILLSPKDKKKLVNYLKNKTNSKTLKELSAAINIKFKTLNHLIYCNEAYIPDRLIYPEFQLKILDRKPDNWGKIKGGKKTYQIIIQKYGVEEIKRRQSIGGKSSSKKRGINQHNNFKIDINHPNFLEFYGALLGDGWISKLEYEKNKKQVYWIIGLSGHSDLDRDYLTKKIKPIIEHLFKRKVLVKFKKNCNGMEIVFSCKELILFLNKKMNFPIGLKHDLEIPKKISDDWKKLKLVIRGIFDTDGSFYFDKTPVGRPYPVVSICMKEPILLLQITKRLLEQGFKVQQGKKQILLKGSIQTNKWFKEIQPSNNKHINKYLNWINAPVAQSG